MPGKVPLGVLVAEYVLLIDLDPTIRVPGGTGLSVSTDQLAPKMLPTL